MHLPQDPLSMIALSGFVGHIMFNRIEPRSLLPIAILLIGPPIINAILFNTTYSNILVASLTSFILYIGTLLCSVVAYRLSPFHPLANYPGPIMCKVTRLWAWYIVQSGHQHRYYKSLHSRYGTHVRTGPNHLHICDASAIPTVLGAKGFPRGGRYEVTKLPGSKGSLLTMVVPHEHAQRRRVWDRGLNTNALQGYQDVIARHIAQLLSALENKKGIVDLSSWFSCFSFDFMGDLAFGGAFKLMEKGYNADGYILLTQHGIAHQELVGTVPWIKPFHRLLPNARNILRLQRFAKQSIIARRDQGSTIKDIFYHLLDEEGIGSEPPSLQTLIQEATLAIAAGSDTTGTTLSTLFYYLISKPDAYARLQSEVDDMFPPGSDIFNPALLGSVRFLNAAINEALRLQPAIPNGVQRVIPNNSGAVIAGRYVSRWTTVQVPTYSVHRDPRYFFPEPDSFIPERWLESHSTEYQTDVTAYFPFSHGPMNCVGKNLALLELRMVVCSMVRKFDIQFAPGWASGGWENTLTDGFLLTNKSMMVILTTRD